jgi:uncharacterized membrane protein YgdD (TMEM256/DUF423 family)
MDPRLTPRTGGTMTTGVARRIIVIGALSTGLAVAFGAFGAHALDGRMSDDMLANYETGARYHFYHSLGMIAVGLLALHSAMPAGTSVESADQRAASNRLCWSALLMVTGIVLFSGSLYTMALTGQRWLGAVTPFGGVSFLGAWALLAWAALEP